MTKREFLAQVIATSQEKEMVEFALKEIAVLDKKNEQAKEKRIAKAKEDEPMVQEIVSYLGCHSKALGNEIAQKLNISTPKAIALCKKLVDNGTVKVEDVSIAKVGKRKAYSLIK